MSPLVSHIRDKYEASRTHVLLHTSDFVRGYFILRPSLRTSKACMIDELLIALRCFQADDVLSLYKAARESIADIFPLILWGHTDYTYRRQSQLGVVPP